jgi:plastocyanin
MIRGNRWVMLGAAVMLLQVGVASGAGPHTVSQKEKKFSVATLAVKPGEKVLFKNEDDIIHNVFSTSKGLEFNLSAQKPGMATEQAFAVEGVAEVRCAFHPTMKLTITVKK